MGTIMMVLTWMGFTLPPECCAYWVGEVGDPPSEDRAKRLFYAQLLNQNPLLPNAG